MRGLGVNWIEVLEFLVAVGGMLAVGYLALRVLVAAEVAQPAFRLPSAQQAAMNKSLAKNNKRR